MKIQEEIERKYQKIDFETRMILIHKVQVQKMKIKYAGQQLGLNESTAKRIIKKFRTERTITKFKKQKSQKAKGSIKARFQQRQKSQKIKNEQVEPCEVKLETSPNFIFQPIQVQLSLPSFYYNGFSMDWSRYPYEIQFHKFVQ